MNIHIHCSTKMTTISLKEKQKHYFKNKNEISKKHFT